MGENKLDFYVKLAKELLPAYGIKPGQDLWGAFQGIERHIPPPRPDKDEMRGVLERFVEYKASILEKEFVVNCDLLQELFARAEEALKAKGLACTCAELSSACTQFAKADRAYRHAKDQIFDLQTSNGILEGAIGDATRKGEELCAALGMALLALRSGREDEKLAAFECADKIHEGLPGLKVENKTLRDELEAIVSRIANSHQALAGDQIVYTVQVGEGSLERLRNLLREIA